MVHIDKFLKRKQQKYFYKESLNAANKKKPTKPNSTYKCSHFSPLAFYFMAWIWIWLLFLKMFSPGPE
jgi:hypothetical protein